MIFSLSDWERDLGEGLGEGLGANDKLCAFCTVFEFNSLTNHKVKFMFATCECHLNPELLFQNRELNPTESVLKPEQFESSNCLLGLFI